MFKIYFIYILILIIKHNKNNGCFNELMNDMDINHYVYQLYIYNVCFLISSPALAKTTNVT